jgi:hypothetical protein
MVSTSRKSLVWLAFKFEVTLHDWAALLKQPFKKMFKRTLESLIRKFKPNWEELAP